jgi:hypothetical protein
MSIEGDLFFFGILFISDEVEHSNTSKIKKYTLGKSSLENEYKI